MSRKRVVVGVSDAPANARTLAWALGEAAETGAELVVTRGDVNEPEVWGAVARNSLRALEIVDRSLARAVAAARARLGDERVTVVVDRDPPAELLIRHARPSDLIVLGAPAHAGWWARGSTTVRAATRAHCPVVVVHAGEAPEAHGVATLFHGHVVVGVDGSAAAREALGFGFAYAAEHRRPLVAVAVVRQLDSDVWFDDTMFETHLSFDPEAAEVLASEPEPWHFKYPAVSVKRALVAGSPADGLRRASTGAAMLAVGTAGPGPSAMGSVSRSLVDQAYCPVAIVH